MVDKSYREKKIATKTLNFLISKIIKNKGYVITFPNRNISTKIFSKKNFRKLFHIYTYEFFLKKRYKVEKEIFVLNSLKVKIGNKDMKFIDECLKKYKIFNFRNKNYLNWRYNLNFDNYKISRIFLNKVMIGLLISKFYSKDKSICICEIFYKKGDGNNLKFLIQSAINSYKKNKPVKIKVWTMHHFNFHRGLLNFGFKRTIFKTNVCTYKNLPKNDSIKKMYLSMGDSDIY